MTLPVFLGSDLTPAIESLSVEDSATLGGTEGRHAASVRRIGAGEWVDVVDGCGLRATCEVSGSDKSSLSLIVRKIVREDAPNPEVILVQALAKGGRDEAAVEICTEIGIDRVIPWASQRAIVQWKGPKAEKGRAKWEGVARAAAKQSRRAYVPVVEDVKDSRELASWVASLMDEAGVPSSATRRRRSRSEPLSLASRSPVRTGRCPRGSRSSWALRVASEPRKPRSWWTRVPARLGWEATFCVPPRPARLP